MVLVMPVQLVLQEGVGVFVVGDFLESQEGDESFLEGVEAAFDFAFGGGIGGNAVVGTQGGKGALELGMGVETICRGAMAKKREAVGIETGWQVVGLDGPAQVLEVVPSGVATDEGAGDDFAGVIIQGEDEHRIMVGGPPSMGRTVVLPEFADGAGLPAAARFGAGFGRGGLKGKMLADVSRDGGAGAAEVMAASQFVGQEGKIERLAVGQKVLEKIMDGLGPGGLMVAAGRSQLETGTVLQPLVAQLVKASGADQQPLGGGEGIERAGIEGGEDFLDIEGGNTVSELFFFIAKIIVQRGALLQTPVSLSLCALVELGFNGKKRLRILRSRWLNHSTEGLPTPLRLRSRRALSCVGVRSP